MVAQTQMKNAQKSLTEFEGALLAEIRRLGPCTTYEVRRAFETSRSHEFSGSSGAVYPAIKRLIKRFLIIASPSDDARGTLQLELGESGAIALRAWASDVSRAVGPGFDPFRTRSSDWRALPPAQRRTHMRKLESAIYERISELEEAITAADEDCRPRIELDLALQRSRLAWLNGQTLT